MIEATVEMLQARRREHVVATGVLCGLFVEDPPELVRRLEQVCAMARQQAQDVDRRTSAGKRHAHLLDSVADWADFMLPACRQVAELVMQGRDA